MDQHHDLIYTESQRFRQWWLWLLVFISPSVFLLILFNILIFEDVIEQSNIVIMAIGTVVSLAIPAFLWHTGLDTEVDRSGIRIKFRPFHRKWVEYKFNEIKKAEACMYRPIMDYGGWCIRYGRRVKGKAYSVSGNSGVLLTFNNNKKILIGSRNHKFLFSVINDSLINNQNRL